MSELLINKKTLTVLLIISLGFLSLSLWHREIGTDDAWLAEQSYWLGKQGYVRSELFYGVNRHNIRHLAYHRLLIWEGALAYKLFGWSASVFKGVLFVHLLLFLLISRIYLRRHAVLSDGIEYRVFYILILSFALLVKLSYIFRPDVMAMVYGFVSFFMLHSAIKWQQRHHAIMAGVFAGVCVLTHLNGVVYVFAGGVLLLFTRNYRLLVYFGLAAFVVSMLYFVEFRSWDMFREYYYQLRHNPALSDKDFSVVGSIVKFLSSYQSYFHKGSDASYTLLLFLVFWTQRRTIMADENLRIIFWYFVAVAVGLALISPGSKSMYLVYHVPYAMLLIAALYKKILQQSPALQRSFVFLLALFLLTQWGETYYIYRKQTPGLELTHRQVSQAFAIPAGARIVAPITYVFNEIDKYTIQSFYAYRIMSGQGLFRLSEDFFKAAGRDQRQYLILTDHELGEVKVTQPHKGQRFDDYVYLGRYGSYHGFKHI